MQKAKGEIATEYWDEQIQICPSCETGMELTGVSDQGEPVEWECKCCRLATNSEGSVWTT